MTKEGIISDLLDITQYAETEEVCIRNWLNQGTVLWFKILKRNMEYPEKVVF